MRNSKKLEQNDPVPTLTTSLKYSSVFPAGEIQFFWNQCCFILPWQEITLTFCMVISPPSTIFSRSGRISWILFSSSTTSTTTGRSVERRRMDVVEMRLVSPNPVIPRRTVAPKILSCGILPQDNGKAVCFHIDRILRYRCGEEVSVCLFFVS